MQKLSKLVLADNRLSGGLQRLVSAVLPNLTKLDLSGNKISSFDEVSALKPLKLRSLDLLGNPIENKPDYRTKIFNMLDELEYLDNIDRNGTGKYPHWTKLCNCLYYQVVC